MLYDSRFVSPSESCPTVCPGIPRQDELQQPPELKQDPELLELDAELVSAMELARDLELGSMLQSGLDLGTELKPDPTLSAAPQILLEPDPAHARPLLPEPDLPQDLQQLNMEDMESK